MEYTTVLVEHRDDHVTTITLNRPDVMNSFNQTMCDEFKHLWEAIKYDDDVHAVVLRAAGDRAFCTGVDTKEGLPVPENEWSWEDPGMFLGPRQNRMWKPVIAAVHGMAVGGALTSSTSATSSSAPTTRRFDPHVNFGMVAALEPIGLFRRLPMQEISRFVLLGKDIRMTAERGCSSGSRAEVMPREELGRVRTSWRR